MQHGFPVKVRSQEGRLLSCPGPEGVQKELHSHGGGYRPVATLALSHRPPPTKQPLVSVKDTFLGAAVQLVVCFLEDAKLVTQSCPTLCDPLGCSPRGSPVRGVVWARMPRECVAISFTRGSSWPRDRTWVSCFAGRFFIVWANTSAQVEFQYNGVCFRASLCVFDSFCSPDHSKGCRWSRRGISISPQTSPCGARTTSQGLEDTLGASPCLLLLQLFLGKPLLKEILVTSPAPSPSFRLVTSPPIPGSDPPD